MSALTQIAYEKYFGKRSTHLSDLELFYDSNGEEEQEQTIAITNRKWGVLHQGYFYGEVHNARRGLRKQLSISSCIVEPANISHHQISARANPVVVTEPVSIDRLFRALSAKWKEDTKLTSSLTDIVLHPAYQRIIGFGPQVVPLILRDLQQNGGHWFWALEALTGENPCSDEDAGRVKKMTLSWIEWGKENAII